VVKYQRVKLTELHEDPANARMHPDENLADIRASLKEFGQVEPLVVAKSGKVIGGNGRLKVMRELGWEECDVAYTDFSDMKTTALGIALNRAGERAEWDKDTLETILKGLEVDEAEMQRSLEELQREISASEDQEDIDIEDHESGEDQSGDLVDKHCVLIHCDDEQHQLELLERFQQEGLTCRSLTA